MRDGRPDPDRHQTDVTVRSEHEATTWRVVGESALRFDRAREMRLRSEAWHAPSWNKAVEISMDEMIMCCSGS